MAGRFFHAPLIEGVEGLRLAAVATSREAEVAERHPQTRVRAVAADVINADGVDLVVVATPNHTHYDLAREALLAGRHVVVDKPFTVTAEEAETLSELARSRTLLVTVFHNRRWDGDFLTLRQLIAGGSLGEVVFFESRFDRHRPDPKPGAWREGAEPGSGVLYDLGPHLIDQALALFGSPTSVHAEVRRERSFGGADDAFDLCLSYPSFLVRLGAGMLVRESTPRFLVRGTRATWIKHGFDVQETALRAGPVQRDSRWGAEGPEQWGTLITDAGRSKVETLHGNYFAYYENVRDAIHGKAPPDVTAGDAIEVMRLIEQAWATRKS